MSMLTPTLKRYIPTILSIAIFMEAIDVSIINTAIPTMARQFGVSPIDLKVSLISYLLTLAVFIPISGWLADRFGIKRIFLLALFIFTISSFFCGLTSNIWELTAWRAVQGLGGALMTPIGRLMIVRWFEREELITTMNRVIVPALFGPALGPLIGGWITQQFSWPWIFWVNIPFGIFAILFAWFLLPEERDENIHRLDITGFLLFGLGIAGFVFALSGYSEEALSVHKVNTILFTSIFLLALYVWHSRQQLHPILDMDLFQTRTFRISILGNLFVRLGFSAAPFILALLLQVHLHYSPQQSGAIIALVAFGAMFTKIFSKKLLNIAGFKTTLIINTLLLGLALILFCSITETTPTILICIYTLFFGCLMSMQFSSMNPLAFADIPKIEMAKATSLHSTTQQLSQSFSVAVCALILKHSGLNFSFTFFSMSLMTMAACVIFLFLKKEDGKSLC